MAAAIPLKVAAGRSLQEQRAAAGLCACLGVHCPFAETEVAWIRANVGAYTSAIPPARRRTRGICSRGGSHATPTSAV